MIIKDELKNIKNIKLLIFDIDGTLVQYTSLESLVKEAYSNFYVIPTKEELDFQKEATLSLLNRCIKEKVFSLRLMSEYWNEYMGLSDKGIHPIDFACTMLNLETKYLENVYGVKETIKYLKEYKNLVCSTNWFLTSQRRKLDYIGVNECISKVYTCEMEYAKPSKYHFKRILNDQDLLPSEALMIGDSLCDLSSEDTGIQSVLVDYNLKKEELYSSTSSVISDFSDLVKVLKI